MSKVFSAIGAVLRFLFGVAKKEAPAIQQEIERIMRNATAEVEKLKHSKTIAELQKQAEDDIAAVRQTAEHHVALIRANLAAKIGSPTSTLPSVAEQFGMTGASGGSGPTGPTS